MFELWNAIKLGNACELSVIMAPEDKKAFKAAIQRDGYGVVDRAFGQIRAEEAEAWSPKDLADITAMVQGSAGGFATLNATVQRHLARWFQSQGGIKVAALLPQPSPRLSARASHPPASSLRTGIVLTLPAPSGSPASQTLLSPASSSTDPSLLAVPTRHLDLRP